MSKMTVFAIWISLLTVSVNQSAFANEYVARSGHPSLQNWLLPEPQAPENNQTNDARVALGKMLFFDPRLSGDGNMSCASCHNPMMGWSDGLPTARGFKSQALDRATPTIVNTTYNALQMWDGRKKTLEDQAMGPLEAEVEMNMHLGIFIDWLASNETYKAAFAQAYPDEAIDTSTASKAIAAFERTVVSRESAFDRWVAGDKNAMTPAQKRGFELFVDQDKGNCAACHLAPNFTDDGFHNVGLASFSNGDGDPGRYSQIPLGIMKGAFKTPTLRDVELTAPYFHDGSASTLREVIDHYATGGHDKTNLSPSMKPLDLDEGERDALVQFLTALTSDQAPFELPVLPGPGSTPPPAWAEWQKGSGKDQLAQQ